jgi:hypothetical protein
MKEGVIDKREREREVIFITLPCVLKCARKK